MAYYSSNDIFAEDPTCFIDELNQEELLKLENKTYENFKNYYRMTNFEEYLKIIFLKFLNNYDMF